jgi:hypothetical protein
MTSLNQLSNLVIQSTYITFIINIKHIFSNVPQKPLSEKTLDNTIQISLSNCKNIFKNVNIKAIQNTDVYEKTTIKPNNLLITSPYTQKNTKTTSLNKEITLSNNLMTSPQQSLTEQLRTAVTSSRTLKETTSLQAINYSSITALTTKTIFYTTDTATARRSSKETISHSTNITTTINLTNQNTSKSTTAVTSSRQLKETTSLQAINYSGITAFTSKASFQRTVNINRTSVTSIESLTSNNRKANTSISVLAEAFSKLYHICYRTNTSYFSQQLNISVRCDTKYSSNKCRGNSFCPNGFSCCQDRFGCNQCTCK